MGGYKQISLVLSDVDGAAAAELICSATLCPIQNGFCYDTSGYTRYLDTTSLSPLLQFNFSAGWQATYFFCPTNREKVLLSSIRFLEAGVGTSLGLNDGQKKAMICDAMKTRLQSRTAIARENKLGKMNPSHPDFDVVDTDEIGTFYLERLGILQKVEVETWTRDFSNWNTVNLNNMFPELIQIILGKLIQLVESSKEKLSPRVFSNVNIRNSGLTRLPTLLSKSDKIMDCVHKLDLRDNSDLKLDQAPECWLNLFAIVVNKGENGLSQARQVLEILGNSPRLKTVIWPDYIPGTDISYLTLMRLYEILAARKGHLVDGVGIQHFGGHVLPLEQSLLESFDPLKPY